MRNAPSAVALKAPTETEAAEQAELSFRRTLGKRINLRVDAYYKRLSHLRPRYENLFEPIELFPETTDDRISIQADKARLRGVELLLRASLRVKCLRMARATGARGTESGVKTDGTERADKKNRRARPAATNRRGLLIASDVVSSGSAPRCR